MILERDQWHLGYASLIRDCRGTSDDTYNTNPSFDNAPSNHTHNNGNMGQVLILTSPTADALSASRIVSYMLRADGVPYRLKVCLGWERLQRTLEGAGVVVRDREDEEDATDNNNNRAVVADEDKCDIRAVVLINMGANKNLSKLFANVKVYVMDSHRPYHLANIHTGKNVVLFNDRPLSIGGEEGEIPSDGDDLSGGDVSSDR